MRFRWSGGSCASLFLWAIVSSCAGSSRTTPAPAGGKCKADCPVCDPALGCVECSSDANCPAGKPRCVRGSCEVCTQNADCPATSPTCFPDDHKCHGACTSTTCSGETALCNAITGACVGCNSNADCADPETPLCDPVTSQCVTCLSNANCGSKTPLCYVRQGKCVACLTNADCPPAAPVCGTDLTCGSGNGCSSETCGPDAGTM